MNTPTQKYQADELLYWHQREGDSVTRRPVAFRSYAPGGRAVVEFGFSAEGVARRHEVPVSALSRPETPSATPIYHSAPIRPPEPPKAPSEAQLAARIDTAREALTEAHESVRRAKDVTRSTGGLVQRGEDEVTAATAALRVASAAQQRQERQFELSIRRGETPPAIEPGEDRAAIERRVASSQAALTKFRGEHETAQARLSSATAAVRAAAVALITSMLEQDIARLRQMEQQALQFRADLIKLVQWGGANGTALKLTEAASTALSVPPDYEAMKFLPTAAVGPWERFLRRLIEDPAAEFGEPVTVDRVEVQAA